MRALLITLILAYACHAELRTWTSVDGSRSFEGELQSYDPRAGMVSIIRKGGHKLTFSQEKLSQADQDWLRTADAPSPPSSTVADEDAGTLLREDFSRDSRGGLAARLLSHKNVHLAEGAGPDGSDAIRVDYVGDSRGSQRVVMGYPLSEVVERAKLSFDVRFDEDFQWVRGGKLHGLGPERPVTGGKPRRPDGWSARIMFGKDGNCRTYLYDQDKSRKYGIGDGSRARVFKAGKWHHVDLEVVLNDPGKSNGSATILVDGREIKTTRGVEFRGAEGIGIRQFLFSTFHGGHSPEWAPKKDDGSFTTVHAFYDNIVVTRL